MAEAECDAYFTCECGEAYMDEASCRDEVEADVTELIELASDLKYDAKCAHARVDAKRQMNDCRARSELSRAEEQEFFDVARSCKVYFGKDENGDSCTTLQSLIADSCDRGLLCVEGTCVVDRIAELGESCGLATSCLDGYCDISDGTCKAFREKGQSCQDGAQFQFCDDGLMCQHSGDGPECVARPNPGDECGMGIPNRYPHELVYCDEDAYCGSDDLCHERKAIGESCQAFDCELGARCAQNVCEHAGAGACGLTVVPKLYEP